MAGGLAVIPGDGSQVLVQGAAVLDNNDTLTISSELAVPGVSGWTEGGGDTPTRDVVAFEGVSAQSGRARAQTIECEVAAYAPFHQAWRLIRAALIRKTSLTFTLRTPRIEIYPETDGGVKFALTGSSGVVALTNGTGAANSAATFLARLQGSEISPGMVVEFRGSDANGSSVKSYALKSVGSAAATAMELTEIAGGADLEDIAATANVRISVPSTNRGPFAATVAEADRITTRAEGEFTAGMTLTPTGILPEVKAHTPPNFAT